MANQTNEENWAARERLRAVEVLLWWRGWAGRTDLLERFRLSPAQASSDFQKYLELNGSQIIYQTSRKRYEATAAFKCLLHVPRLEEALSLLGGTGATGLRTDWADQVGEKNERLERLQLPLRLANREVERLVFMALLSGQGVRVNYHSLSSDTSEWRVLRPAALAWDGRRWHVRAWCETRQGWRDFVIGRISEAEWPQPVTGEVPVDTDWQTWETVRLQVNPALGESSREALKMDYSLENDTIEIPVRRSMKHYLMAELFIATRESPTLPAHFVLQDPPA